METRIIRTTFDGVYYDFQGNCTYLLAGTCPCSKMDRFQVYVQQPSCSPGSTVSCIDTVIIELYGYTVTFKESGIVTVSEH